MLNKVSAAKALTAPALWHLSASQNIVSFNKKTCVFMSCIADNEKIKLQVAGISHLQTFLYLCSPLINKYG